jgi:alpha/beta superfamily hydrolase
VTHDFTFLAPCPASGLIVHGEEDTAVPPDAVHKLVERLSIQKGVTVDVDIVPEANHFFTDHLDQMIERVSAYLDDALPEDTPEPLFE